MYRINTVASVEQVKNLILFKLQREEELKKINDTLALAAPEMVQQAYDKLVQSGQIVPETPRE